MITWEYKVADFGGEGALYLETWLNKYGAQGWQVIHVRDLPRSNGALRYTFQRQQRR